MSGDKDLRGDGGHYGTQMENEDAALRGAMKATLFDKAWQAFVNTTDYEEGVKAVLALVREEQMKPKDSIWCGLAEQWWFSQAAQVRADE